MTEHKVVSRAEWQAGRDELLRRETEYTRLGDELALPVRITGGQRLHAPGRGGLPDIRDRGRGAEFLMNYYPILDRVPKGRDEGDGFQTWIRRHDEYA
jgi:predicted dithiol-disulfide oxidoreductase (DUF899 family)